MKSKHHIFINDICLIAAQVSLEKKMKKVKLTQKNRKLRLLSTAEGKGTKTPEANVRSCLHRIHRHDLPSPQL